MLAIHDAPSRIERLRAEQAELRTLLEDRPPDRQPEFRQAERALASAKKDLHWANRRLQAAHHRLEEVGPEIDQRQPWDADHNWPDSRLRTVETELAELRRPAHHIEGVTRESHLLRRAPGRKQPWLDRVAEVAPPPLPGHDLGAGLDLVP